MRAYTLASIQGFGRIDSPSHPSAMWHCACISGILLERCSRSKPGAGRMHRGLPPLTE
jgi:hypothetical protein